MVTDEQPPILLKEYPDLHCKHWLDEQYKQLLSWQALSEHPPMLLNEYPVLHKVHAFVEHVKQLVSWHLVDEVGEHPPIVL